MSDAECRPARDSARATPRIRSGLAYVAGFAGLIYLFGPSYSSFIFDVCGLRGPGGAALVSLWSLWSPAALVLSYAAAASLDRSRDKAGRVPAMVGFLIGLYGMFDFLRVVESWVQFLS